MLTFAPSSLANAVLVLTFARSYPKTIEFTVNENGLAIGEQKNYSYGELKGFIIRQGYVDSELVEIVFQKKSRLSPYIKILASDQDAEVIKEFLIQYLPEVKYEESLIGIFSCSIPVSSEPLSPNTKIGTKQIKLIIIQNIKIFLNLSFIKLYLKNKN